MKNKMLFLLPLLLIIVATQCMEQAFVCKPKTIQEIRKNRRDLYRDILRTRSDFDIDMLPFDRFIFQKKWNSYLQELRQTLLCGDLDLFNRCLKFKAQGYSALGIVTMAIIQKVQFFTKNSSGYTYFLSQNNIPAPFNEKKEHIQQLLTLGFEPTSQDKDLAILEKWEGCNALLIKNLYIFLLSPVLSEVSIPQEIMQYITLLMWEAEESLL